MIHIRVKYINIYIDNLLYRSNDCHIGYTITDMYNMLNVKKCHNTNIIKKK
jgi:hypothetical protein